SSRRRHTRSKRDWSSDVCSSDLAVAPDHFVIVFLEFLCGFHLQIPEPPVAVLVVQIVGAILQEDADRLVGGLADDAGIAVTAAEIGRASCRERGRGGGGGGGVWG